MLVPLSEQLDLPLVLPPSERVRDDADDYLEAWALDPALRRLYQLSRVRGIEVVDGTGYL